MLRTRILGLPPNGCGLCTFNASFLVVFHGHWRVSRWCYLSVSGSLPSDTLDQLPRIKPRHIVLCCSRIHRPLPRTMKLLMAKQLVAEAARMPFHLLYLEAEPENERPQWLRLAATQAGGQWVH